jgi:hypothetical protein
LERSRSEQASAALEEVTVPSAEEEAAPTLGVEEAEAIPAVGGEVASRRGGLEATKASHSSTLREPEIVPEAIETPTQEEVAGPGEDLPTIGTEAPEAPSHENYLHTAFVYIGEDQSVRIIWN